MSAFDIIAWAALACVILGMAIIAGTHSKALNDAMHRATKAEADEWRLAVVLANIEAATRNLKSGTARKVNRMAREGLGVE